MIQSLFLPNDCNDGSERLEPAAGSLSGGPEADDCFSVVWTAWAQSGGRKRMMDTVIDKMIPQHRYKENM